MKLEVEVEQWLRKWMNQSWEMDLEVVEVEVLELESMEKSKAG